MTGTVPPICQDPRGLASPATCWFNHLRSYVRAATFIYIYIVYIYCSFYRRGVFIVFLLASSKTMQLVRLSNACWNQIDTKGLQFFRNMSLTCDICKMKQHMLTGFDLLTCPLGDLRRSRMWINHLTTIDRQIYIYISTTIFTDMTPYINNVLTID